MKINKMMTVFANQAALNLLEDAHPVKLILDLTKAENIAFVMMAMTWIKMEIVMISENAHKVCKDHSDH
jgi:hypothetical protein